MLYKPSVDAGHCLQFYNLINGKELLQSRIYYQSSAHILLQMAFAIFVCTHTAKYRISACAMCALFFQPIFSDHSTDVSTWIFFHDFYVRNIKVRKIWKFKNLKIWCKKLFTVFEIINCTNFLKEIRTSFSYQNNVRYQIFIIFYLIYRYNIINNLLQCI